MKLTDCKFSSRIALAAAAVAALAGCSLNTDEVATSFVAPGKFDLFSCQQIRALMLTKANRVEVLKELMEKAGKSPGGGVAVALAYRTEYVTEYGEWRILQDTAVRKNCDERTLSISERSLW